MSRRMVVGLLLIGLLVAAVPGVLAQEEPTGLESRAFHIKHKPLDDVTALLLPLLGDDGSVTMQRRLRTVTVTDTPARLERIGSVLKSFDVPPRQVNVAVQLILGNREIDIDEPVLRPRDLELPGIDGTLRDTIGMTNWPNYRLLAQASFTAWEGEKESMFALGDDYRIRMALANVDPVARVARFDRFALERAREKSDGTIEFQPIWDAVLHLRDQRLTVFGATQMESSDRAIFLAITAGLTE